MNNPSSILPVLGGLAALLSAVLFVAWAGGRKVLRVIGSMYEARGRAPASEALLRRVLESSPDCVKTLDLEGRLTWMNECGVRLMEVADLAPLLGRHWPEFWPGEGRQMAEAAVRAARDGGVGSFEGFCPTAAGTPKWWSVVVSPVLDNRGRPERLLSVSRDITPHRLAEDALRDREAQLRRIADAMPQMVWVMGAGGALEYANERWRAYAGMTLGEASAVAAEGGGWVNVIHPDDRPVMWERWRRAVETGEPYEAEHRVRRAADGAYRWHLARAVPQRDADGRVVRWLGTSTDIHEQKVAERALRLSEERYRLVSRVVSNVVWDWDLTTDLLYWSEGLQAAFGYGTGDLGPAIEWWEERIHPDDRERVTEGLRRVIDGGGESWVDEYRFRRADGTYALVEDRGHVLRGPGGAVERMVGAMQDLTEQRRAEEALRFQNALLASQAEASVDGILVVGADERVLSRNRRFAEIWRTPEEALASGDDRKVLEAGLAVVADPAGFVARVRELYADRRAASREAIALRDGRTLDRYTAPLVGEDGTYLGRVWYFRDVTEDLRAAELERERNGLRDAVRGMERVLGVVGHELRTPIAATRATAEFLLAQDQLPSGARAMVTALLDEVVRMSATVNDLLEVARINSGTARWNWSEFALAGTCEDAAAGVRPLLENRPVSLDVRAEPAGLRMRGDPAAVRRLVLNLLSNAQKHTAAGEIAVRARAYVEGGAAWVRIDVRDTGCGMPPERAAKLGEAFALNAGVVGSDHVSGTGLGLAICRGIVAAHGGRIGVESAVGRGTRVTVFLRTDLPGPCAGDATLLVLGRSVA